MTLMKEGIKHMTYKYYGHRLLSAQHDRKITTHQLNAFNITAVSTAFSSQSVQREVAIAGTATTDIDFDYLWDGYDKETPNENMAEWYQLQVKKEEKRHRGKIITNIYRSVEPGIAPAMKACYPAEIKAIWEAKDAYKPLSKERFHDAKYRIK